MTTVLTALTHWHEGRFVAVLGRAGRLTLVRRCADLAELLSAGAAGVARVAVVSPDLRGLDREALRHLAGHGIRVAGLVPPEDEDGERQLRQLGVVTILRPDDDAAAVEQALAAVVGGSPATPATGMGWRPDSSWPSLDKPTVAEPDDQQPRPSPVTVVWGPTGAPGRTTVAVTTAAQLAVAGIRTMLVDLDTWGASVAQVLGMVNEAPGVAAAARASEQGTLDVLGLARLAPEVSPGFRVLTGLPRADRWPELRAAAVEDILELARGVVEHVVVDAGFAVEDDEELSYDTVAPRRNAATLAALGHADALVVVGAADPVGLQRLVRAVQDVAVISAPPPVVVVNKVRSGVAGPRPERAVREVLGRFAGMDGVRMLPWSPDECDAALLAGRCLTEVAPTAAFTRAVGELARVLDPRAASGSGGRSGRRHARRRLGIRLGRATASV
ncbi:MAG: AAA family ATPase [Dermatophilaceae bacterium]